MTMQILPADSMNAKPNVEPDDAAAETNAKAVYHSMAEIAAAKKLPIEFLERLGVRDDAGRIAIDYFDESGEKMFTRLRPGYNGSRFYQPKGVPTQPYGQESLGEARRTGKLFIVEGESNRWTLKYHGLPALGLPGAETAKRLTIDHVDGLAEILIIQDPDAAGEAFVRGVLNRLAELGSGAHVKVFRCPNGIKDVSDLHVAAADADAFIRDLGMAIAGGQTVSMPAPQQPPQRLRIVTQQSLINGHANGKVPAEPKKAPRMQVRLPSEFKPFPWQAFPGAIGQYVHECGVALQCDSSLVGLHVLAAMSVCNGNATRIRAQRGWDIPTPIWAMTIGDSGSRKSAGYQKAVKKLFKIQKSFNRQYEMELEILESNDPTLEKVPNAKKPHLKKIVCSDITFEKLAKFLKHNPRGILVACNELVAWLTSFSRYKNAGGAGDLQRWLETFDAEDLVVDRSTGDDQNIHVSRAHISVCGCVTPGTLRRVMTPDYLDAGLAARLLMAMPPTQKKKWLKLSVDPETEERYVAALERILKIPGEIEDGEISPYIVRLADATEEAWGKWYDQWAERQFGATGATAASMAKLEGYCLRFALLHHVADHAIKGTSYRDPLGMESLQSGITLTEWFFNEAQRIYAMLRERKEQNEGRRVLEYLDRRDGKAKIRDIAHAFHDTYTTSELRSLLEALQEHEYGAIVRRRADGTLIERREPGSTEWFETCPEPMGEDDES